LTARLGPSAARQRHVPSDPCPREASIPADRMSGSLHRPARDIIISIPAGNPDALSAKTGLDNLPILDKVA
jgi:hypothetical protein